MRRVTLKTCDDKRRDINCRVGFPRIVITKIRGKYRVYDNFESTEDEFDRLIYVDDKLNELLRELDER